jgi:predicted nucleotidyltransferase
MPVRSLHSSVTRWPNQSEAFESFRSWAYQQLKRRADIVRIGCFGSLAHGAWGFGSDIDIVVVLKESTIPVFRRAAEWDLTSLPVAAEIVVLTEKEAENIPSPRFREVLNGETRWLEKTDMEASLSGKEKP